MGVIDELLEERDALKVEVGERIVSSDLTLYADDLGSCIGVAAYDPKIREGCLMHSATYGNEGLEDELDGMSMDLGELRPPFEILVGGTLKPGTDPAEEGETMIYARALTEKKLSEASHNYLADWNNEPKFNRLVVDPDYGILYDSVE